MPLHTKVFTLAIRAMEPQATNCSYRIVLQFGVPAPGQTIAKEFKKFGAVSKALEDTTLALLIGRSFHP
jgi:hypothetical protein